MVAKERIFGFTKVHKSFPKSPPLAVQIVLNLRGIDTNVFIAITRGYAYTHSEAKPYRQDAVF